MKAILLLSLAVFCLPAGARAQSANDLLAQGIRAYTVREYDGAAWLLQRALAVEEGTGLAPGQAARALMYLAAAELARNQRDAALAAARRLIVIDQRFRPDADVFPAQALALLQEARRSASVVSIQVLGDTAIRPGVDVFAIRLAAKTTPEVAAAITTADGRVVRTLYTGPVRDSVDVRWNGLDASGNAPPAGRYSVLVTPAGRDRRDGWTLRLPLEVARQAADTTPLPPAPPDSLFRPERGGYPDAWRAIAPGLLAAAAIVVLPKLVAEGERPSDARWFVGGTMTVAGIAAFLSRRHGRTIPANTQYNRKLREDWRRSAADISRRNGERSRQARMIIRPGAAVLTIAEGP